MLSETRLYQEIHEQPDVLARLLEGQRAAVAELARAVAACEITQVVIAARGTSDNAGRYAQYVLGARNGLLVGLAAPSLVSVYRRPPRFRGALVLGISQSGASPDIVAAVAEARRQGALTAVLTNDPRSDLAREGDVVIDMMAGEERSVAATKTYTAELAAIALLSATLDGDAEALRVLAGVPEAVATALTMLAATAEVAERWRDVERSIAVGRGFNFATAFEIALKLKELTYAVVEPYSSADFLHGPLAIVEEGFPAIVLAPSGVLADEMVTLVTRLRERGAEVLCISDRPEALAAAQVPLAVPCAVPEWLSPLTFIVPGQLLAMNLAHALGHDVDAPRALRKVTRTR